jgi:hypothetical protein
MRKTLARPVEGRSREGLGLVPFPFANDDGDDAKQSCEE